MSDTRLFRQTAAMILLLLGVSGCRSSTQTEYLQQSADLGSLRTVAVMPFETLVQEKSAAEKVQKIFYLELLSLDVFEVKEPGVVAKLVPPSTVGTMGPAEFQKLGKDLGVDALFMGTVIDFGESRQGATPAPEVTIQLRLVETQTGTTIWSTSKSKSGAPTSMRLFGVGGQSITEAARELIRSELDTLFK